MVVSADTDFGDFVGSLGFKGAVYNLVSERGRETTGKVSFITFDSLKAGRGRLERRGGIVVFEENRIMVRKLPIFRG